MKDIYSNNFNSADPKDALISYNIHGVFILKNVFNSSQIDELRTKLDLFYSKDGDKRIRKLSQIDKRDINFYMNYFYNEKLKLFFDKVFNVNQNNIYLLPPMHFAKNYLPHSKFTRTGGWHRDCGGELKYKECKKLLSNRDYYFGKVGIYCQNNGEYGGGIDVIPKTNLDYIKNQFGISWGTIGVKLLRLIQLISKSLHKHLSRNNLFHKIFGIKKLKINKGDVAFFDARIWHKGSFALKNIEKKLDYDHEKLQANLPNNYKKYVLYSHFGNFLGIKSYLIDRDRRTKNNNLKESTEWKNELSLIYDNDLLNKYKNYKHELQDFINQIVK